MSIEVKDIIEKLRRLAPENLAQPWDNVGLQIGSMNNAVKKILLALDVTQGVIDEAIQNKADMIVTHHPLIFTPLKKITKDDPKEESIYKLIQNNINVYVMHTNLDSTSGGTNDVLGAKIGIFNSSPLVMHGNELESGQEVGLGRIGNIETTTIKELSYKLKEALEIHAIRVVGDLNKKVSKIAICTGSGMSFLQNAIGKADVYITGDIKFHEAQEAILHGIGLIDVGHYASENIVMPSIKSYLNEFANRNNLEVIVSKIDDEPFITI